MMLNYFSRWITIATKEELNLTEQLHAESLDKFFGSNIWRRIAYQIHEGMIDRQDAEKLLIDAFDEILREADNNLSVKQIPLKFQDREQPIYNLFLTTRDPTGAFTMNEILASAHIREYDYRVEKRQMRKHPPQQMQFEFVAAIPDQNRPTEPEPDIDYLADKIYEVCRNRTMIFRDVLREMVNSPYYFDDMKEALGKLKREKRASFEGTPSRLKNATEIKFV